MNFKTTENNSNFIRCRPAVRDTCNIKVAPIEIHQRIVRKNRRVVLVASTFRNARMPPPSSRAWPQVEKTTKPQLNDGGWSCAKGMDWRRSYFGISPALFSSLEPNHSTKRRDTIGLNQGSNVWDVPKSHVTDDGLPTLHAQKTPSCTGARIQLRPPKQHCHQPAFHLNR